MEIHRTTKRTDPSVTARGNGGMTGTVQSSAVECGVARGQWRLTGST